MAVQRFVLDSTTLDDAAFGLDGGAAFILDTSTLDSANVLDGGQFQTLATATATLGGLSSSASATVTHSAVLSATLGGLTGSASATVTHSAVLSATLGGLTGSASASVTAVAVASANLGGLAGSASATVSHSATASASLGSLVATANATDTPPTPTPEAVPVGGRQYPAPRRIHKEPQPTYEVPVIEPKKRYAILSASFGGMNSQTNASITFSILEDDAEVLLLL